MTIRHDAKASPDWRLTRRRLITSGLFAGLVAATPTISNCTIAAQATPTGSPVALFPRTVGHGLGEVTIPAKPERIVATADRDQLDVLLAMGVKPVLYGFSGDYEVAAPWIPTTLLDGLEKTPMPGAFEPNLEAIVGAQPDLIVDAWATEEQYQLLSAIAPTVEIKVESTTTWQEAQRLAGSASGLENAAEAAIGETETEIDRHAQRLISYQHLTVAVTFQQNDQFVMIPGNEIGARIVAALGMTVVSPPDGIGGLFSLEQMGELLGEADIILSLNFGNLQTQDANPVFRQLPAVQAQRYVAVTIDVASACYQESTLSLRWAAGPVADALIAAAEGRGKDLS